MPVYWALRGVPALLFAWHLLGRLHVSVSRGHPLQAPHSLSNISPVSQYLATPSRLGQAHIRDFPEAIQGQASGTQSWPGQWDQKPPFQVVSVRPVAPTVQQSASGVPGGHT